MLFVTHCQDVRSNCQHTEVTVVAVYGTTHTQQQPTLELPQQAVFCASCSSKRLRPLALAALRQLAHHAAEQAAQLQASTAAHVGMRPPCHDMAVGVFVWVQGRSGSCRRVCVEE